jgi:hypothetical protein
LTCDGDRLAGYAAERASGIARSVNPKMHEVFQADSKTLYPGASDILNWS